jgi:hypothetical protein
MSFQDPSSKPASTQSHVYTASINPSINQLLLPLWWCECLTCVPVAAVHGIESSLRHHHLCLALPTQPDCHIHMHMGMRDVLRPSHPVLIIINETEVSSCFDGIIICTKHKTLYMSHLYR